VERPVAGADDAPQLFMPDEAFPPYRFVPGHTPHPFAQKGGYAYGERPPNPPACAADDWRDNRAYLRGVDFFNRGWWWEAHEAWEGYWHSVEGVDDAQHDLMKGLIQLAACALNRERGHDGGADRLLVTACDALERARRACGADSLCGLDLPALASEARERLGQPVPAVNSYYLRPA
jgi:hypothetical protein